MDLIVRASGGRNIVLRPQGRPAFYSSVTSAAAIVEVWWHFEDESPSAARLIGRYLPGQTVQWPYNPVGDRNIVLRTVSISASGVRSVRDLRDAPAVVVPFQREIEAPTITQVGDATQTLITLAIDNVSRFAVTRRVRIADDEAMTTMTSTQIAPASFVDAAFIGALARAPGTGELIVWRNALKAAYDTSEAAVIAEAKARVRSLFEDSPGVATAEYTARGRTDGQFVTDCYAAYLNRLPDQIGYANHLADVTGHDRAYVLANFGLSSEFEDRAKARPYAEVPAGQTLPRLIDLVRNDTETGTRTIWVRVSHSSGSLWGAESPARSFTYADNVGAGGDPGDTDDPFQRHEYLGAII